MLGFSWKSNMKKRTGVIVKKLGMSSVFKDGAQIPVTVLKLEECIVVGVRTQEKNGYDAVILGSGHCSTKHLTKADVGLFFKEGLPIKKKLAEFRVDADGLLKVGSRILPSHFLEGQYVDVTGITIGRGFTGAMKRHGFHGLRASHGVSITHRSIGSTGANQDPGRVWKNQKMPGQHGGRTKTVLGLRVVCIDEELGLICVMGAVPGHKNSILFMRDAIKKRNASMAHLPFPAAFSEPDLFGVGPANDADEYGTEAESHQS